MEPGCRVSEGLFYGDPGQLAAQAIGAVVCFIYVWGLSWIFFKIVDRILGMRVTPAVELAGVDIPEMGTIAYPPDWGGSARGDPGRGVGVARWACDRLAGAHPSV